jgi:DNA-binding response OmpR family regulator
MNAPLRILLIEDSAHTVTQLRELFGRASFPSDVAVVTTEDEAVNAIIERRPDFVVLDIRLQQGTGFNVLRKMTGLDPKPPVAVFTNYAFPRYRDYALLTGADYFLDKAVDFESLGGIVESLNARRSQ